MSKDDLITSIWGGRIVSVPALTSRINAARKAVGDSGEHQRLIRTISRKGIRFVAEVSESAEALGQGGHSRPAEPSPLLIREPGREQVAASVEQAVCRGHALGNLSGDPAGEYFAEGIAEDIITELSRVSALFVIARNSSFTYRGRSPDLDRSAASWACATLSRALFGAAATGSG